MRLRRTEIAVLLVLLFIIPKMKPMCVFIPSKQCTGWQPDSVWCFFITQIKYSSFKKGESKHPAVIPNPLNVILKEDQAVNPSNLPIPIHSKPAGQAYSFHCKPALFQNPDVLFLFPPVPDTPSHANTSFLRNKAVRCSQSYSLPN